MSFKRPAPPMFSESEPKRTRPDDIGGALVISPHQQQQQHKPNAPPRLSHLLHPNMQLIGHEGEIYAARFSPDGNCLASAGFDMKIFLWDVFDQCENFSTLSGHTGAVMDLHFASDTSRLYTCSTDKTVRIWDMHTGACLRKLKSHTDIVNSCHPARRGPELVCSGGDDGHIIVHDARKKEPVFKVENTRSYQVTAVTFNDTSEQIISGGIDNIIKIWDMRRNEVVHTLPGHSDIITGLSLSPDGSYVLSNAMDCTARIWDVRPYAPSSQRCLKIFTGHQHNFEKNLLKCAWSPDGNKISVGSSDSFLYVWDVNSKRMIFKLPGHLGSVNATDFHPQEPIILSAGSDKQIFLGELRY